MNNKKLIKSVSFGDIHFGAKSNSDQHNQDCLNYLRWLCSYVKDDPSIDHINFLGDWHENRSAINISTMMYSHEGGKLLDSLGLPVFFVLGNHDLGMRHTRETYSTVFFQQFNNFHVITEPTIIENIGNGGALLCPYLFHDEYKKLANFLNYETWWGHFEFKDFIVTGYNVTMKTGPDAKDFEGPKYIVSGHYHKRQAMKNVVYCGNVFPTSFGDAGDRDRGLMVYDHSKDEMIFENWDEAPQYVKIKLSALLDNTYKIPLHSRVKCLIDIPISFEESTHLQKVYMDKYNLRDFTMEETLEISQALTDTETDIDFGDGLANVSDLIIHMIQHIDTDHIDNELLLQVYYELR